MATSRSPGAIKLSSDLIQLYNRGTNELVSNDFNPASGGGIPAPRATLLASVDGTKLWIKAVDEDPHAYTEIHTTPPTP